MTAMNVDTMIEVGEGNRATPAEFEPPVGEVWAVVGVGLALLPELVALVHETFEGIVNESLRVTSAHYKESG